MNRNLVERVAIAGLLILLLLGVLAPGTTWAAGEDGTLKWYLPGGAGSAGPAPALGPDGTIYYLGSTRLTAVTPDGAEKWYYGIGSSPNAPVVGPDGTIYVAASGAQPGENTAYLYAINPDGTLKWKYPAFFMCTPAIGADGTIYAGDGHGSFFYAFNPADGSVKWQYQADSIYAYASPVIGRDGTIYVGLTTDANPSWQGYLCAFRPDGTIRWKHSTYSTLDSGSGYSVLGSPAIGADGTVYAAAWIWPGFFAVRPDGSTKWWNPLHFNNAYYASGWSNSPVIGPDGSIYIYLSYGNWDATLFAFTSGGALKWSRDWVYGTPAISRDGTIFAGGDFLCRFNPDGTDVPGWGNYYLGQTSYGSPTIGPDGTIYVVTSGYLMAINSNCGGPATNAPWPMFQRDAKHNGRMPSAGTAPFPLLLLGD